MDMDNGVLWEVLEQEIKECSLCELCSTRKNTVVGDGNKEAKIVFVGEAPGQVEDDGGLPFQGRAGQLLNKILAGFGVKREDVYICNTVKCRPPENRNPRPEELVACRSYLDRQIDLIKPDAIICLGTFAAQAVLNSKEPISKLRGAIYESGNVNIIATFHPAYALRNPSITMDIWRDLKVALGRR
jgi:DNA polymerase